MTSELDKNTTDDDLQRLLRAAGRREQPPDAMVHRVRDAVRTEWRAATIRKKRARRRRWLMAAAAASVAVSLLTLWATWSPGTDAAIAVASVARTAGEVNVRAGFLPRWRAVEEQQQLRTGQELITGTSGRVSLAFGDGTSVRLDHDTTIELADADRIVVHAGAVYVDAKESSGPLQIDTPGGSVNHVGTQYEVRLLGGHVRIRVREGEIELTRGDDATHRGRAGEQLTVSPAGYIERVATPVYGEIWSWAETIAPAVTINGRPLSEFLTWVGRELGREIVFATPASQAQAADVILRGSIEGLTPREALAAVLSTTRLISAERDGQLVVTAAPDAR